MTDPITLSIAPPRVERLPYNQKTGERLTITTTEITVLRDTAPEERKAIREAVANG